MLFIRFIPILALLVAGALIERSSASLRADPGPFGGVAIPVAHSLGPLPQRAPDLPFADNPDPTQCGIPAPWLARDPVWMTGYYQGTLVQPVIYLYDSHLRREVVGQIPSGSRIEITLSQTNPELNYFHVSSLDLSPPQAGWVPAPFVTFDAPGDDDA